MALNIKQTQTESELESMRMMLNAQKKLFENISSKNAALNIKQIKTESELDSLRMIVKAHKELFENISSDMIDINEKIKVAEVDLKNVKTSSKDIDEKIKIVEVDLENVKASSKDIHNRLLEDYASDLNSTLKKDVSEETKAWYNLSISSGAPRHRNSCNVYFAAIIMLLILLS